MAGASADWTRVSPENGCIQRHGFARWMSSNACLLSGCTRMKEGGALGEDGDGTSLVIHSLFVLCV